MEDKGEDIPAVPPERVPRVQYIRKVQDLYDIRFSSDGLAAVEVPFRLLDTLPLVGEKREMGPRLAALVESIRRRGYMPTDPIICRIGMKGRWVVVDGGHRITAARIVGREFWSNLFGPKVRTLYFLLFTTEGSWIKLRRRRRGRETEGWEPRALGDPEL